MNTPSHVILNLAILGRRKQPHFNLPIVIGSLLPDAALFGFYIWVKFGEGLPEQKIWSEVYFQPFWQDPFHWR